MVPWFVILFSELRFRKINKAKMKDHPFKMPFFPISNYLAIIALFIILIFMFLNPETTVSLLVGVVFLIVMTIIYFAKERNKAPVKFNNEFDEDELKFDNHDDSEDLD